MCFPLAGLVEMITFAIQNTNIMMQRLFFSFLFAIASALSVSAQEDFSGLKVQLPDGWSTNDEESALRFKEHDIVKTAKSADNPTGELVVFGERPDGTKLTAPFVDLDKQIFSFDIDERQKQVVFCFGVSDLNNKWQPQGVECSGKPIAHITKPVRMIKRVGNMLYVASGKKFFGVDLNTINQAQ